MKKFTNKSRQHKSRQHKSRQHKSRQHKSKNNKINTTHLQSGKGVLNSIGKSIGSAIYHKEKGKNYTVRNPLNHSLLQYAIDPSKIENLTKNNNKPRLLTIYYNYKSSNQFKLSDLDPNIQIPTNKIEKEPYVIIDNMGRYLLAAYEEQPYNKLYWLAEFRNRSKFKTLFTYTSPEVKNAGKHKLIFKLYKYPLDAIPFVILDMAETNRTKSLTNFFNYVNSEKNKTKIIPVVTHSIQFKQGTDTSMDLFNLLEKSAQSSQTSKLQGRTFMQQKNALKLSK